MLRYVAKRLAWSLVVLWAITALTFAATFLSPIDPARSYAGVRATDEQVERVREKFGLDDPLPLQYVHYLGRLLHGDLGTSFSTNQDVLPSILDRLPETALLALGGQLVQLGLGLPLGLVAALRRGQAADRTVLAGSLIGVAVPPFVLGFLLLYFLAFKLGWFSLGGSGSLNALILPAVTLGLPGAAWYARMLRSTVLNILNEDYVRMARAKGMPESTVIFRHVLRNAASPVVAMIGLDFGVFFGGVLVVERVFAWPGIGDQAWNAISANDIPLILGTVLFAAFFVTLFNLLADLVNAWLDPRARYA